MPPPPVRFSWLLGVAILANALVAGEMEVSVAGGPTIRVVEEVRRYTAKNPSSLEGLRSRLGSLLGRGPGDDAPPMDREQAEQALQEWLTEHLPEVAGMREGIASATSEDELAAALEARHALLQQLTAPMLQAGDSGMAAQARAFLRTLGGGLDRLAPEEGADGSGGILEVSLGGGPPEKPAPFRGAGPVELAPEDPGLAGRARQLFRSLRERLGY